MPDTPHPSPSYTFWRSRTAHAALEAHGAITGQWSWNTGRQHGPITADQHAAVIGLPETHVRTIGYCPSAWWVPGHPAHGGEPCNHGKQAQRDGAS